MYRKYLYIILYYVHVHYAFCVIVHNLTTCSAQHVFFTKFRISKNYAVSARVVSCIVLYYLFNIFYRYYTCFRQDRNKISDLFTYFFKNWFLDQNRIKQRCCYISTWRKIKICIIIWYNMAVYSNISRYLYLKIKIYTFWGISNI